MASSEAFRSFLFRRLTLCRLADFVNVGKIVSAARGELRGDQIVSGNKESLKAGFRVDHAFEPPLSRSVKIDAWNVGKNVEYPL